MNCRILEPDSKVPSRPSHPWGQIVPPICCSYQGRIRASSSIMEGLWTINSLFLGRGCHVDYLAHVQGQAQRSLPPGFSLSRPLGSLGLSLQRKPGSGCRSKSLLSLTGWRPVLTRVLEAKWGPCWLMLAERQC